MARAESFVQALTKAGKNPTRAGLMAAMLTLNQPNRFALPGVLQKTSTSDHFIISQMQLIRYKHPDWRLQAGSSRAFEVNSTMGIRRFVGSPSVWRQTPRVEPTKLLPACD